MKKFLIVPVLLSVILLAGCSLNKTVEPEILVEEISQDQVMEVVPDLEEELPVDTGGIVETMPAPEILVEEAESAVLCTMDAKICPDGSAVGRIAPDCEFSLCPGEE